jgi:hypothetical protein
MTRWRIRPDGSTWGDFGPDDTLGRLNLVGPEQVRRGIAEVRDGIVFCLSLPLDRPGGTVLNPNRFRPWSARRCGREQSTSIAICPSPCPGQAT